PARRDRRDPGPVPARGRLPRARARPGAREGLCTGLPARCGCGGARVVWRSTSLARQCGSELRVETRAPQDGRRRFRGRLLTFDAGVARMSVDGSEVAIAFADVARARTVYEFTRDDFAQRTGGSGR